jgi:hypothetical protein
MVATMPMLNMMDPLPFVAARMRKKAKEKEMSDTQRVKKVKNNQWAQDIRVEKLFAGAMKPQGQ